MKYLILFLILSVMIANGQNTVSDNTFTQTVEETTAKVADDLIAIRRDLHRNPEAAGEEKRTAGVIADFLRLAGLEVYEGVGGYGVVGILKTDRPGKKVAWRADIDALLTELEDDPVEFKSEVPGVRHICGHDVHTAIGLGIAKNIATLKNKLSGTYYFVFQPAEENITGAQSMLEDGLMELINPDEFYALHLTPFPTGVIATKSKELYAHYKKVQLMLESPDTQELEKIKASVASLENVTDKQFGHPSSFESELVGIAGNQTIYSDYTYRESDFRIDDSTKDIVMTSYWSFSNETQLSQFREQLQDIIDNKSLEHLNPKIEIRNVSFVIKNDQELTQEAIQFFKTSPKNFVELSGVFPGGRSDDFALFLNEVPGTYFFVGASNFEQGKVAMPHNPEFHVDESVIAFATSRFTSFLAYRGGQ